MSQQGRETLTEILRRRALEQPDRAAFTFLADGEQETASLTYAELDAGARAVAALLQERGTRGERVLLLFDAGLEFVTSFFGCLYAGAVAVPAPPPHPARLGRTLPRVQAIAADSRPAVALTTAPILSMIEQAPEGAADLRSLSWLKVDGIDPGAVDGWRPTPQAADDLAYLQYTSGSTSTPKGVMVTHFCLTHQSEHLARAYGYTPESVSATWMPNFHDYGLVEGIVHPAVVGVPAYLFSPLAFVQRPARWLEIVTRYGVTHSSGPNFAYELCVRKVTAEERAALDLSSWRVAGNAAEPVHRETLERFHEKFAPRGFRWESFYPSFGLAEATLMVSAGGAEPHAPLFITARASALERDRRVVEVAPDDAGARSLVGCGRPIADTEIAIVGPETQRRCAPDELGEIWVKCEGLARGFWQRPDETEATFHARIADTREGPFMRTGDLGFMRRGELFVGGRVKDLIIIRGQNYYPQDIEWTAEQSHPLLRPGCCAAFSVEVGLEERLVLVQEIRREFKAADATEVVEAIRERVAERHELQPYSVVLVKTGAIHKTSSGKIQRHASRREFLEGSLDAVARWQARDAAEVEARPAAVVKVSSPDPAPDSIKARTIEAVREWLVGEISRRAGVAPEEVDTGQPFRRYGFDSAQVVALAGDLGAWLDRPLPATFLWDYPTADAVARRLGEEPARRTRPASPSSTHARDEDARAGERAAFDTIAIVGMGCRFPGAENVEAFWRLLRDGVDAVTEVPQGRWEVGTHDAPPPAVRRGGFLKSVDGFDARFFGVSPREAAQMDPQQRLLLEVAWEALEDAGLAPDRLGGTQTGVFVGISNSDYAQLQFGADASPDAYAGPGSALSIAANRISYLLDLRGPSMAVDTACSSSLVAVHAACRSLRAGESNVALAGGVNLMLTPKLTEALARAGMMSADGRCKTFDAAADGYVRSEGCGVVVLKRLADAARDGDRVVALIRGSAVNQDGRSNGLTAPNGLAQQALLREALADARVAPSQIGYVEAHGTGTPLGDPIEFDALGAVLREERAAGARCLVGSVKTNIGHLEAAAGIAGLIKAALSLEREHVPPHLHLRSLNPHLAVEGSPLEIVAGGRDWKRGGDGRFAGVSSFGFGGTNAHVILEEAPASTVSTEAPRDAAATERPAHVLTLSAQSDNALRELARRYSEHLALREGQALADVCFTANVGRARFDRRLALVCETREQLARALRDFADGVRADASRPTRPRGRGARSRARVAFLFTGQGAQYVGMGRELYETQPSFRRALDRCDEILRPALERPLLSVLYGGADSRAALDETAYTQPALFALEYALAELWRAWGVEPDFVFGHSVGEYAAACLAGAFSLDEGLSLVAARARLMQSLPASGAMAAVFADENRVARALEPFRGLLSIAAVNGPSNTVVSGERGALDEALGRLEADGVGARSLNVSHAFHSPLMEPVMDEFARALRRTEFRPLRVPLVTGLTGEALEAGALLDAEFWLSHAREPVRFDDAMRGLAARGCESFVEIGPDAPLLNMGRRCLPGAAASWLPSMRRGRGDWRVLLDSLAVLYESGVEVDWEGFDRDYARRRVQLPTYPFERKSYWLEAPVADSARRGTTIHTPEGREEMTTEATPRPHAGGTHAPADSRRKEAILERLRDIVGRLLQTGPETLDAHASFLEMGADSIVLAEAIRVVEDSFLLKISIRQLFEQFTTLDALAEHIEKSTPESQPAATQTVAPHDGRAETPRTAVRPASPACALPAPAAQNFIIPTEVDEAATGAASDVGPPADSLERVVSRQLDLLAQFSGLMSQQLSALGRGRVPAQAAPTPEAGDAPQHPRLNEPPKQIATTEPTSRPARPASGDGTNGDAAQAPAPAAGNARAPYVPFRPVEPGAVGGFSERQRRHLSELIERFTQRTAASKELARRYRSVLADSRAIVGFRLSIKEMLYPIVGAGGDGARLRDVDGNDYVDITMGFGVHLLGHRPPFVAAAIEEQLRRGIEMGPRPALAGEVAALVCELTGMERAAFCNSGTEAVMTALRLARARTGRTKVAIFAGSYHGHSDGTLARAREVGGRPQSAPLAPGIPPRVVEDLLVLEYGSPRALELLREHAHELAAVLVEPVQSRHPELQPREFLHELRAWTREAGVVLIFDEMVTGFRIHPGGAQAWFGVEADLATYGKIAGGGLPVGIVAGRASFMDGIDGGLWDYGDASYPRAETTYFGGTFCQHPLAMAAAHAVLTHLKERGPSLQAELNERTSRMAATLNEHFAREEMPIRVAHFGSLFRFNYTGNLDLLFYHLLARGVYVWEWRNCFLSTAHTDEEIARVVSAVVDSADEMRAGGFIQEKSGPPANGSRPREAARPARDEPANGRAPNTADAPADARHALGFWGRRETKPALVTPRAAAPEPRAEGTTKEAASSARLDRAMGFSLSYFGNYDAPFNEHKYDLLIEGARFADRHGFEAVWIPERHFHAFGGLSPAPSVVAAALARETERVCLRAGSVVLPLHHAVRVAEEWAVVDNLSRGRAGVSFASGWHPNDFVFAPEAYGRHRELMFERIEQVRRLWRGESLSVLGGAGNEISVRLFPQPMQRELPVWVTVVNNPETYRRAGEIGAGVLTNLMGQTVEDLARNVSAYRRARADAGHDPARGRVTLLMHTLVGGEAGDVRACARGPFCDYLKSSLDLFQNLVKSQGLQIDFERLSADDMDYLLASAYERYVRTSALIGTPDTCAPIVKRLSDIGVDEVACFIDFGVDAETVLGSLPRLDALRSLCQPHSHVAPAAAAYELATTNTTAPPVVRRAPTTSAQKQLWALAQVSDGASCAYNETLCLWLRGPLDTAALAEAVRAVVARHEALRTSIANDGEEQLVHATPPLELPVIDLSGAATADKREGEAWRWLEQESRRRFDLAAAPLLRARLVRLEDRHHLFVLSAHHVVADGWSVGVMLDEVCALYEAARLGVARELDEPLQFADYAERLCLPERLAKQVADESYWLTRLTDAPPRSDLPADRPRPPAQSYNGARLHTTLDGQLYDELKRLGRRHGCTLFMTLLAGYLALLHRLTGQRDVVIGIPVAGREERDESRVVGFCTRPLPVRSRLNGDPTFAEFMTQVRGALMEAYEHADYSALSLIEKLRRPRDASRFPLFTNTFNMEPLAVPQMSALEVEWVTPPAAHSKFDCGLNVMERGGRLQLDCDFNTDLFDVATVARTLGRLRTLLEDAARDSTRRLSELELMDEGERRQVVSAWNDEARAPRELRCVHEVFAEVARRCADRAAVVRGDARLTYAELDERAEELARRLRGLGLGPGTLAGVCLERSAEMVVAMLAVLKAGGAYVPLDPSYPEERLSFMLDDAKAHVLLTRSGLAEKFSDYWGYTVRLDEEWKESEAESAGNSSVEVGPENLAYVIYTSGSTGRPKGVAVPHRAVHNLVAGANYVTLDESDVVAQVSNSSFDAATFEVWGALLSGARLVIIDKDVALSPREFAARLAEHGVTALFLTTALFNQMADEQPAAFGGLRHLLFGGEAVEPKWVREVLEKGRPERFLHVYGPTETTTFATFEIVESVGERAHTIPIGRPLTNVRTYLLDERLRPVPPGVAGELYVGGAGLARGYLDRPGLTAEKFIPDPFSAEPGARLYRTGDAARFLPDGRIEFLGRRDGQVKIRGFRVEPGEVEALLSSHAKVARAAVVAREDSPGERRLVAYVVPKPGETCGAGELRRHLGARLPEYMLPSAFVTLDELPLSPGGKVNRAALPAPDESRPELETKFVAPRTEVERKLAEFCAEVLGLQTVGVEDDFFDLGGHSLHATRIISRVRGRFHVELPISLFFEARTLAALARHVEQAVSARA